MRRYIFYQFLFLFPVILMAQWSARQSLGAANQRAFATSFSVNGKIYVVGGQNNFVGLADVKEYDVTTDSWTNKSAFPGGVRGGAVAFTIGNKGYYMCGSNYTGQYFKDVWEYDPSVDVWTQKNNFPGDKREEAVGFSINNLGYVGTGYQEVVGPNSTFFVTYADFYEYNPGTDTWLQKAMMPTPARGWAIGVSANGKGYVGLGSNANQNTSYGDFYEYDPATNTWTAKANYGLSAGDAMAFSINGKVFVCGGINFANSAAYNTMKSFNPSTNLWTSEPVLPAGATMGAVASTVGNRAFLGTGYNAAFSEKNDWWEYQSVAVNTLCPAPVSFSVTSFAAGSSALCTGSLIVSNVSNGCSPYTFSLSPNTGTILIGAGNTFTIASLCAGNYTAYVSDANCCGTGTVFAVVSQSVATDIADERTGVQNVSITPNPNEGTFTLSSLNESQLKCGQIQVCDALGRYIPAEISELSGRLEIQLLNAEPGIYFVSVLAKGKYITKKIMVR